MGPASSLEPWTRTPVRDCVESVKHSDQIRRRSISPLRFAAHLPQYHAEIHWTDSSTHLLQGRACLAQTGTLLTFRDTTYILSSAVAKLLGKDFAEREAIKKEITRLYRTRSQIVHGADSPSPSKVEESRHRVIDLNIAALQRLLRHRRDLIGLTAQKRSLAILLGAKRSR